MTMTTPAERLAAVTSMIHAAFADAKYPGDDAIVDWTRVEIEEEGRSAAALLVGKRWEDVAPSDLRYGEERCLLTDEGYRCFFPAFLLAALDEGADMVVDGMVSDLTEPADSHRRMPWFRKQFSHFWDRVAQAAPEPSSPRAHEVP